MSEKVVIDRFIDEFAFLSNFHPSTIYLNGKPYATVEHAYQAAKTLDESQHETIRTARNPGEAKNLGKAVILRPDWEDIKVDLMRNFVKLKFENPLLRELLLATDDATLIEGNFWNDREWGVCRGEGKNLLGKILMQVRDEIRSELLHEESFKLES
jgi:hypothetical protein